MSSRVLAAVFVTVMILFTRTAYSTDHIDPVPLDSIETLISDMKEELEALPPATTDISRQIDEVVDGVMSTLEFASEALNKEEFSTVTDSLGLAKGSLSVAQSNLPNNAAALTEEQVSSLEGKGLEKADVNNVKALMQHMADVEMAALPEVSGLIDRVSKSGMDLAKLDQALDRIGSSTDQVTRSISFDLNNLASLSQSLQSIINNPGNINALSREIGMAVANLGGSLQQAAEAVAYSIAAGVNVNLDAAAQGMGYSSFAAAVDAYNAAHGTSYTVDQAKDALGQ